MCMPLIKGDIHLFLITSMRIKMKKKVKNIIQIIISLPIKSNIWINNEYRN